MKMGNDFFKVLNLVVGIMRLIAKIWGDEDEKKAAVDSELRSSNENPEEAC